MGRPSKAWARGSTRAWRRLRLAVLNRDGWTCQLCSERIDPTLRPPHPMSSAVHHTVGRRTSGDDPRYLVAAHRQCNEQAGSPERNDPRPVSSTRW
jgi:5-methylcytosine-specific restriction endonuclease McrA